VSRIIEVKGNTDGISQGEVQVMKGGVSKMQMALF
jgi:hypothetical protein